MKNRRLWQTLALATAAMMALVACGAGDSQQRPEAEAEGAAEQAPGTAEEEPTEIVFWTMLDHNGDDVRATAERQMVENFEEQNPDIKVRVESTPWQELPRKTIVGVETGTGPDVARLSFSSFRDYVEADILLSLNEFVEDWSEEERADIVGWDSTVFNDEKMSFIIAPLINSVMYRKDLFEQTGLDQPRTWEELAEVAEAMTTDQVSGFGFALQPGGDLIDQYFWPYMWGDGSEPFAPDGSAQWSNESGQAAAEWLAGMMERGAMPSESLSLSLEDVLEGFRAGNYAMIIDGSNRFGHATDSEVTEGNVGLWEIPSAGADEFSPPQVLGWSLGIAKDSEHPEEAWRLVEHMISNESNLINAQIAGEIPSRSSTLDDPWFQEPEASEIQWYADYADRFPSESPHPVSMAKIRSVLVEAIHQMHLEGTSAEDALEQAAVEYETFLAEGAQG